MFVIVDVCNCFFLLNLCVFVFDGFDYYVVCVGMCVCVLFVDEIDLGLVGDFWVWVLLGGEGMLFKCEV